MLTWLVLANPFITDKLDYAFVATRLLVFYSTKKL